MYKTLKEQEAAKRREALAREGLGNILPIAGEDIFDLNRFLEDTRHMIVMDVLKDSCPVGFAGERMRVFLSDKGFQAALRARERREMEIVRYAKVVNGDLYYTNKYNYLAAAEMGEEENYNQIDGVINNKKPSILAHLQNWEPPEPVRQNEPQVSCANEERSV